MSKQIFRDIQNVVDLANQTITDSCIPKKHLVKQDEDTNSISALLLAGRVHQICG
jgi:hypothetical protein